MSGFWVVWGRGARSRWISLSVLSEVLGGTEEGHL